MIPVWLVLALFLATVAAAGLVAKPEEPAAAAWWKEDDTMNSKLSTRLAAELLASHVSETPMLPTPKATQPAPRPRVLLPRRPYPHEVVGYARDGAKIRAAEAERVINDMLAIDAATSPGRYREHASPRELDALNAALSRMQTTEAGARDLWPTLTSGADGVAEWPL